jgi:hypothetical protein
MKDEIKMKREKIFRGFPFILYFMIEARPSKIKIFESNHFKVKLVLGNLFKKRSKRLSCKEGVRMSKESNRDFFCSELSLEAKEEMFGTVPRVDVWFLLEYTGSWGEKAFPSSKIPENVKKRLSEYLNSIPNSRIQLIKRHQESEDTLKFYIGFSDELEPKLFEISLSNYEDLLSLDIPKVISHGAFLRKEPLFLVCTHGTHDKCCGKFGVPVYLETVKRENGFLAWQCTHLGGHRFTANFLCLPHGIYYGRVRESDVARLINEYQGQLISIENYRGRSCYSPETQAAEYFLRLHTGIREIHGFHLKKIKRVDKEVWIIEFISESNGKTHRVHIERDSTALKNYTSCKDEDKSPIAQYRLIDYKELM